MLAAAFPGSLRGRLCRINCRVSQGGHFSKGIPCRDRKGFLSVLEGSIPRLVLTLVALTLACLLGSTWFIKVFL